MAKDGGVVLQRTHLPPPGAPTFASACAWTARTPRSLAAFHRLSTFLAIAAWCHIVCLTTAARMEVVAGVPSSRTSVLRTDERLPRYPTDSTFALRPTGDTRSDEMWVTDNANHRVCRLALTNLRAGLQGCVGQFGVAGFRGDGGSAASSLLNSPKSAAVYETSSPSIAYPCIWIADAGNKRIRYVNENGVISTYAGGASSNSGLITCRAAASKDAI